VKDNPRLRGRQASEINRRDVRGKKRWRKSNPGKTDGNNWEFTFFWAQGEDVPKVEKTNIGPVLK